MIEFFIDLILASCWIWAKSVMNEALKEVNWLEEVVRGVEQCRGTDAHSTLPGLVPSLSSVLFGHIVIECY